MKIHPFLAGAAPGYRARATLLRSRRHEGQAGGRQATSDGQTLAAFGAAGVDHGTAAFGGHANAEAVRALATDDGGLVGTFHYRSRLLKQNSEKVLLESGWHPLQARRLFGAGRKLVVCIQPP